ncbi:hypothetical protein CGRA01v4_04699 [Colletotrichum graminicola]|nr:hypothetical protein CGRA01v4_04699 [Colletotrichum graminicola]
MREQLHHIALLIDWKRVGGESLWELLREEASFA